MEINISPNKATETLAHLPNNHHNLLVTSGSEEGHGHQLALTSSFQLSGQQPAKAIN